MAQEEIAQLEIVDMIRNERDPSRRRWRVKEWIERSGKLTATGTLVSEDAVRQLVILISEGILIEDGKATSDPEPLTVPLDFELATLSGAPLGKIKVGLKQMDASQARAFEQRGGSTILYRDYPERFHCSLKDAVRLLSFHGFRTGVRSQVLYEVGGPLEAEALASVQQPKGKARS